MRRNKQRDQLVEDRLRIDVLFPLVNHPPTIVSIIQRKVEDPQDDAARTRRKLANVDAVIQEFVPNKNVICIEWPLREALQPAGKAFCSVGASVTASVSIVREQASK